MLPPPSPSLGRGHPIIILLMVDRGTDNSCRPSIARFLATTALRVPHPSVFTCSRSSAFYSRRRICDLSEDPRPHGSSSTIRNLCDGPESFGPESSSRHSTPGTPDRCPTICELDPASFLTDSSSAPSPF